MVGGRVAVVDAADVPLVQEATWYQDQDGYVKTKLKVYGTNKYKAQCLHRHVLGLPAGAGHSQVVDHLNRDKLDNRRANLEVTSNRENCIRGANSLLKPGKTSRFVGVCWDSCKGSWLSQIHNKALKRNTRLGNYSDEEAAAEAYLRAKVIIDSGVMGPVWTGADLRRAVGVS